MSATRPRLSLRPLFWLGLGCLFMGCACFQMGVIANTGRTFPAGLFVLFDAAYAGGCVVESMHRAPRRHPHDH